VRDIPDPTTEGRRADADVDDDVEHLAVDRPNELALRAMPLRM
jgi:hypothetical protein